MWRIAVFALFLVLVVAGAGVTDLWVKGNTHTHTTGSDGDCPPEVVVDWYKSHGYNFLVLSDHNVLTDPAKYDTDANDNFLLIPGEELSSMAEGKPVHVNGIGIREVVKPSNALTIAHALQGNVDSVIKAGGISHINHPNFWWAFDHRMLSKIERCNLLEVYNGHPQVYNCGDTAHVTVEQMWDVLLSRGKDIYAIAVDDAHNYKEFSDARANPGRGWIMVRVNALTQQEILDNIRKGNFYASTGVELSDISFDKKTLRVLVKPAENVKYLIRFVGPNGQILREVDGPEASYELKDVPSKGYVRAKVISSDGKVAWTQPVRPNKS